MPVKRFTIFEHESLIVGEKYGPFTFEKPHLEILEKFFKEKDFPYYKLIRHGVRFCEYVGVLQANNLVVEVLPKAEEGRAENHWRRLLLDMVHTVNLFTVKAPSNSSLKTKSNSILDLYFKLFIEETETLLHKGLIKRYRKTEGNCTSLKGSIVFNKHIQQNLVHKERFYVRYTTYDREHPLNAVLYKTLLLLKNINTNPLLISKIGNLLLNFPEMPAIKTDESFFESLVFNRKTESYKNAIGIAKLLLLNYHPDVLKGKNDVLALMFDMNKLWEGFVAVSLRKYVSGKDEYSETHISTQSKFKFWQSEGKNIMRLRPDIVVKLQGEKYLVLDTKWKNLNGYKPSSGDLRQMYTYSKFHQDAITALVYPGNNKPQSSYFIDELDSKKTKAECKIIEIPVADKINDWQMNIANLILSKL